MQAVLDFLLEYFYWILGVLVVLLITVIGFLADTKKKKKLRDKNSNVEANNSNGELNNMNMGGMNMNNDLNNMNMGMDNNMMSNGMNVMPNMGVNNLNGMNSVAPDTNIGVNNMNAMPDVNMNMPSQPEVSAVPNVNEVSVAPVDNVQNNNSFFTPASEQTPTFEPREVTIPTPVEPTPIINNGAPSINGWNVQGNANVSPVEVVPAAPEVQPNVPSFGPTDNGANPVSDFGGVNPTVNPVVPETPVMPQMPTNMNVMPETTPQVEPVVNPQVGNPVPSFGPSMDQGQTTQVPPVNESVTPNFVTGVPVQSNVMNNNMNNLNG